MKKAEQLPLKAMFSQKTMSSLKGMHFTTRNDFHYGQWFQQKGATPTKNGFH